MAIGADVANIFWNIFGNFMILALFAIILLCWTPIYLYLLRYSKTVEIEEQVGDGTQNWHTKAGIIHNKKRNRQELHILKNKLSAIFAIFSDKFYWQRPPLDNKYHHQNKKGRKFYKLYKVGENDADIHPIPPINPKTTNIKPVDEKIHSWLAQGLKEDARETRKDMDKWQKFAAVGSPILMGGILLMAMIFTYDFGNEVQNTQVQVAGELNSAAEKIDAIYREELGIQDVPSEKPGRNNTANEILQDGGINLE